MTLVPLTAGIALLWMVPFVFGGRVHAHTSRSRRAWLSAAGGAAVAYVFLDLLPEMTRMQGMFSAAAANHPFPFPHYRVYTSALAGFVLFYAIEHMAVATRPAEEVDGAGERPLVCALQIGGFAVYCGLMAYLLRVELEARVLSLVLYGVAMFCHFWTVDHALRQEHGARYVRSWHWAPCLGILAGWAIAAAGWTSDFIVPTVMGFIAGGIVLNSLKEELPEEGQGRPAPFIAGAGSYAVLLLLL